MELINRDKLLRRMETMNVSKRELARAAGYRSHSYMRRLLDGEAKTLNTDPALRIAHYLHLDVDDIFVTKVESATDRPGNARQHRRPATPAHRSSARASTPERGSRARRKAVA